MHVVHLSVECFPLAKVGGLADVLGALPRYQRKLGVDAWVVCPYYDKPFTRDNNFSPIAAGSFFQGSEKLHYEVLKETSDRSEERRVGKECRSRWSEEQDRK